MFRLWTMKESFIKANGRGMSLPLKDFSVYVEEASGRARVRHSFDGKYYSLREYQEIEGYCTAVCCQGKDDMAYSMMRWNCIENGGTGCERGYGSWRRLWRRF